MTAFWKSDYYTRGNPNLLPERAEEWDASARWRNRFITIDTRYYERRIEDIIVWDLRGVPQKYTPVNLASARVLGREDHAAVEAGDWCGIEYTHVFTDASDENPERSWEGDDIVFTPRHTHDLSLWASHKLLSARVNGRWVTRRYTLRANTKWQGPYRAFDAEVRITPSQANPHVVVSIRGENITNEPIELLQGYPSPARSISAGLTIGLK
jgi:outer membrane cobalamin receptor